MNWSEIFSIVTGGIVTLLAVDRFFLRRNTNSKKETEEITIMKKDIESIKSDHKSLDKKVDTRFITLERDLKDDIKDLKADVRQVLNYIINGNQR